MATWLKQPDDGANIGPNGSDRIVRWVAGGLTTVQDALDDGNFPVAFNDAYPDESNSARKARNIRINAIGFKVYSVEATYSVPEDGDSHPQDPDPGETPPLVFNWQTVQTQTPVDRDVNGNAIITSARRGVQGVTVPRNYKELTITRWEASYNATTALEYENAVNGDNFEGGVPGEVQCAIIQPSTSYQINATRVPIDYSFGFKPVEIWGENPWQTRVPDADSFGYVSVDGSPRRVRFTDLGGNVLTDIPLDGFGVPIDEDVTYVDQGGSPVDPPPSWQSRTPIPGATVIDAGGLVFLQYETSPSKAFSAFGF